MSIFFIILSNNNIYNNRILQEELQPIEIIINVTKD